MHWRFDWRWRVVAFGIVNGKSARGGGGCCDLEVEEEEQEEC